jgi:hypothetical protein
MGTRSTALKNLEKASENRKSRKGVKNKYTLIKESILETFEEIGGTEAMVKWAMANDKNQGDFYKMLVRLLPAKEPLTEELEKQDQVWTINFIGVGKDSKTIKHSKGE